MPLLRALSAAGVDFVVVGGVAVVLHGHPRMTVDLDLVVELSAPNVRAALDALREAGLVPRLPVPAEQFSDPEIRRRWVEERNLTVFSLHDPTDPRREVDLFATEPIPRAMGDTTADWGWQANEMAKRRGWAQLTPAERLEWLDDALDFALASGALEMDRRVRAAAAAAWNGEEPPEPLDRSIGT